MMTEEDPSYIDYEAFVDPNFSPISFANKLVLATNDESDTRLDLSTPLSRVLFDIQEIDTHIDSLTTKSALPFLDYTQTRATSSQRILNEVETQVASLTEAYGTLRKEVVDRYEAAQQVRLTAERLFQTVGLGRAVSRCTMLGRQLELQMADVTGKTADHRAMVRSASTLVSVKMLLSASKPGDEGHGLDKVKVVNTLKNDLIDPSESTLLSKSHQIIREFSMSSILTSNISSQPTGSAPTFAQNEETKSRVTSALLTLYLLSPVTSNTTLADFEPKVLVTTLQDYLQTALKSSIAALSRSLATLPSLDRTLLEISARCQNISALEFLLSATKPPPHPAFLDSDLTDQETSKDVSVSTNLLQLLTQSLDTSSLPSYFWRSLASSMSPRVQEIMNRGGVSARTLRSNRDKVRDSIKHCVDRGSQLPTSAFGKPKGTTGNNWEREAAVMVGAIIGSLGRY